MLRPVCWAVSWEAPVALLGTTGTGHHCPASKIVLGVRLYPEGGLISATAEA